MVATGLLYVYWARSWFPRIPRPKWNPAWQPLALTDFIVQARQRTGVIWWGGGGTVPLGPTPIAFRFLSQDDLEALFRVLGIATRQYEIRGFEEWNRFAKSCHTVSYKDGKGWQLIDAKNYSLEDLAKDNIEEPSFVRRIDQVSHAPEEFGDGVIVTAYDTMKRKRLILDGIHRAAIMTNESKSRTRLPRATVIECYGNKVNQLFPFDTIHL